MPSIAAIIPDWKRCRIRLTVSSALMTLSVAVKWRSDLQSHTRCCRESSACATQKGHVARCIIAGVVVVTSVANSVRPPIRSSRVAVRCEAPPLIAALASMGICSSASRSAGASYLFRNLLGHGFPESYGERIAGRWKS